MTDVWWRVGILVLALAGAGCAGFSMAPDRGQGHADLVRCESRDNRRHWCAADTSGGLRLVRQLSSAPCVQGDTWGYDGRGVWVVEGCGGEFARAAVYDPAGVDGQASGPEADRVVRCESRHNRKRRCNALVEDEVKLIRQLSRTRCVQRQNWGWDRRGVWVTGGCSAEFHVR